MLLKAKLLACAKVLTGIFVESASRISEMDQELVNEEEMEQQLFFLLQHALNRLVDLAHAMPRDARQLELDVCRRLFSGPRPLRHDGLGIIKTT